MRLTEEQYAELMRGRAVPLGQAGCSSNGNSRLPRKYRNEPAMSADGKRFDSKLERDYYERLLLRWRAGEVLWFVRQVSFELEGGVKYRADFLEVLAADGVKVVDTTGVMTPAKANKLKQVKARYGIEVQIVRSVT